MLLRWGYIVWLYTKILTWHMLLRWGHIVLLYTKLLTWHMLLRWGYIVLLYIENSHDTCCYSEDILFHCILNAHMTHVATVRIYCFTVYWILTWHMLLQWGHIVSLYTKYSHDTCCYGEDILCNCILNAHMTHVASVRAYYIPVYWILTWHMLLQWGHIV